MLISQPALFVNQEPQIQRVSISQPISIQNVSGSLNVRGLSKELLDSQCFLQIKNKYARDRPKDQKNLSGVFKMSVVVHFEDHLGKPLCGSTIWLPATTEVYSECTCVKCREQISREYLRFRNQEKKQLIIKHQPPNASTL